MDIYELLYVYHFETSEVAVVVLFVFDINNVPVTAVAMGESTRECVLASSFGG